MLKNDDVTKLINLKGEKFRDVLIRENEGRILIAKAHDFQLCPQCLFPTSRVVDITPKEYRDLDVFGKRCYLEIDLRRFECRRCCCTFTEILSFAAPYRRYTSRFEEEVYRCCQETTAVYAGQKFGIDDKTATTIY